MRNTLFAAALLLPSFPSTALGAQELFEQDFRKWSIVNPKQNGQSLFRFTQSATAVSWYSPTRNVGSYLAGLTSSITVPPALADKDLLLDLRFWGGSTGNTTFQVKVGSLSYSSTPDGPEHVHHRVLRLSAGSHPVSVLTPGWGSGPLEVSHLTKASLLPFVMPAPVWRISAGWSTKNPIDLTLRGEPGALALAYYSPTQFASAQALPGISGGLWLSSPALLLPATRLSARGTAQWTPGINDAFLWSTVLRGVFVRNRMRFQVLELAGTKLNLGSLVRL